MKPVIFGFGSESPSAGSASAKRAGEHPVVSMGDAREDGGGAASPSLATMTGAAASALNRSDLGKLGSIVADSTDEELFAGVKRRWAELIGDCRVPEQRTALLTIAAFTAMLVYSYLPGLTNAYVSWANPQYAHGWIVPLFAAALLFWWRRPITFPVPISARLLGLALLAGSFAMRLFAARFRIVTIDMYTFVPAIIGVFILVGGWSVLRWSWTPLAFLIFMFPLPDEATRYLLGPLQTFATITSTFALQTLGLEAYREGNQIILGEMHLGVVDACSGLRMLTIFCAIAVAMVMVGKRSWWENGIILASAIPIAIIVNSIRITITGLAFQVADSEFAEALFHDWAGLVMMPMALAMLWGEQYLLSHIFIPESEGPTVLAGAGAHRTVAPVPSSRASGQAAPAVFGLAPRGGGGAEGASGRNRQGPVGPVIGRPPQGG